MSQSESQNTDEDFIIGRRAILVAAAGLTPALLSANAWAQNQPEDAEAQRTLPNGLNRLDALVKMRGSMDGRTGFAWIKGTRFARVGDAIMPICGLLSCIIVRYRRLTPDSWDLRLYELAFFTNPATGRYQRVLRMPFTGKEVEVPLYRTGPGRHVVKTSNHEVMSWSRKNTTDAKTAAQLAPDGKIIYEVKLSQPTIVGQFVWLTTDATTRLEPYDRAEKPWFYKEIITNQASLADLINPKLSSVDATASYTLIMDFRPWMQMDSVSGQSIDHAVGGRVWKLEDLPSDLLWHMRKYQPDVVNDPTLWIGP